MISPTHTRAGHELPPMPPPRYFGWDSVPEDEKRELLRGWLVRNVCLCEDPKNMEELAFAQTCYVIGAYRPSHGGRPRMTWWNTLKSIFGPL